MELYSSTLYTQLHIIEMAISIEIDALILILILSFVFGPASKRTFLLRINYGIHYSVKSHERGKQTMHAYVLKDDAYRE